MSRNAEERPAGALPNSVISKGTVAPAAVGMTARDRDRALRLQRVADAARRAFSPTDNLLLWRQLEASERERWLLVAEAVLDALAEPVERCATCGDLLCDAHRAEGS